MNLLKILGLPIVLSGLTGYALLNYTNVSPSNINYTVVIIFLSLTTVFSITEAIYYHARLEKLCGDIKLRFRLANEDCDICSKFWKRNSK